MRLCEHGLEDASFCLPETVDRLLRLETILKRRDVLRAAASGMAAAALAKPALAQSMPEVRWRLTSSFPKSLDTIYGAAEVVARQVAAMTDGKFRIETFAAGEIVPGLQALDAVGNQNVEMCHTVAYYYVGKDPTFSVAAALPFGLNARQQNAWMYENGGIELFNEFFKKYNVFGLPCGNSGAQMGGWFRKEIRGPADLVGLKMRIPGLAGQVLAKLGVVPQQIAGGDTYPALEKGTIDAAEWVGPYDDEKMGFYKVARFYYYPGWWEGGAVVHAFMNLAAWNELPKPYAAILSNACAYANTWMQARYDVVNPPALRRLVAAGAQLRPFPLEIMESCLKVSNELYAEIATSNAAFKKAIEAMIAFRSEEYSWWQVAEHTYDSFMIRTRNRN